MGMNKQLIASLWQLTNPRHRTKKEETRRAEGGRKGRRRCGNQLFWRWLPPPATTSAKSFRRRAPSFFLLSLSSSRHLSLFSIPHSFSHFHVHDLLPLQNLPFEHNYSISSIRICFSLMWMYLNPETYNLRGLFVGMKKLGTCTRVCMNVGFWVQDISLKIPFFIE